MSKDKSLVHFVNIPQILDDCNLCFIQTPGNLSFLIKRVYFISKANTKLPRGFHAHRKTQQAIFCIQGSIKLILDDGDNKETVILDKPHIGVTVDRMIWHEMRDFKKETILVVLASEIFNETDYIRDYEQFKKETNEIS